MTPIGLSTCFFSNKGLTGNQILEKTASFGIDTLELEYRISRDIYREILAARDSFNISIKSLHNFCYRPDIVPETEADADYFRLSSTDDDERQMAVLYTKRTIENARDCGARYVVLHLGDTGQPKSKNMFKEIADEKVEVSVNDTFIREYSENRKRVIGKYLGNVVKSLDELLHYAERYGVTLAIENRYYIYQIPDYHEVGYLLDKFRGAPIGFWLDIGHAFVKSLWGCPGLDEYFYGYREHIIGSHIHDSLKSRDHQPPGFGTIDYSEYRDLFASEIVNILEINSRFSDEDLRDGIRYLQDIFS